MFQLGWTHSFPTIFPISLYLMKHIQTIYTLQMQMGEWEGNIQSTCNICLGNVTDFGANLILNWTYELSIIISPCKHPFKGKANTQGSFFVLSPRYLWRTIPKESHHFCNSGTHLFYYTNISDMKYITNVAVMKLFIIICWNKDFSPI